MITVYDIIIIIVIVLIIAPLILAIIITSRRPKFGRFDNVSNRRKFGSGVEEDAKISELDKIYEHMEANVRANKKDLILQNALDYVLKSKPLITKLKQELDEYGEPGTIPISDHKSIITTNKARHQKDFSDVSAQFQERLDASQTEIDRLTSELERLRGVLVQNNIELMRLKRLNAEKNKQSDNMQPSGNTEEIKQYERELADLRENRKKTSNINELLRGENNILEENNTSLQTSLETLEEENKRINDKIDMFTQQIGEITAQNKRLQQIIYNKDAEIAQLKTQNIPVSQHRGDESYDYGHSLADALDDLNLENAVREEFENNNYENTKLQEIIQAQLAQLEQLTRDINSLRSENEELKKLNLELRARFDAESVKVANLEQQNKALQTEIEQCQNTKDQVESDSNGRLYELIKENTELVNKLESSINDTPPQMNETSSQ